jgi:hypothetical protein
LAANESVEVRREVAFVMGRLPAKISGDLLIRMVGDSDEETRCNALYSLWDVKSKKVKDAAKALAASSSELSAQSGAIVQHWATSLGT